MGRTITTARYEITPEIKELQKLAETLSFIGNHINVDITQDLVIINNIHKYTRAEAKPIMEAMIADSKTSKFSSDFPDAEAEAKEAKAKAKKEKKHREPGAPAELKTVIRRAKRIYKKSVIKNIPIAEATLKATKYLHNKLKDEDLAKAGEILLEYIQKN